MLELTFRVIADAFVQRLPDSLRDGAVNLPRHQHRIGGNAESSTVV